MRVQQVHQLGRGLMQVASWPRENAADVRLPRDACNVFRDYCSRSMYQVGASAAGLWVVLSGYISLAVFGALSPSLVVSQVAD